MKKYNVGLLGCGDICDIYFKNCLSSEILNMAACASLHEEKAHRKAQEYNIPKACSIDELISDTQIDIILNLTVHEVHGKFILAALETGKHVYSEKPLAAVLEDGQNIIALAKSKGLKVGCAPDTFLGGRLQTCRKAIDDGLIGEPTAAAACVVSPGHEWHHPNPEFFYKPGGGPLLDIGPYYLTALVSLLGPVKSCCGFSKTAFPERTVLCGPKLGDPIKVEVPTYISGTMEFSSGVIGTITASFDIWDSQLPRIEIYGTAGTLCIPDADPLEGPNVFGGRVLIKTKETSRPAARRFFSIAVFGLTIDQRSPHADRRHGLRNSRRPFHPHPKTTGRGNSANTIRRKISSRSCRTLPSQQSHNLTGSRKSTEQGTFKTLRLAPLER
jgi:predicted dehydrogenase